MKAVWLSFMVLLSALLGGCGSPDGDRDADAAPGGRAIVPPPADCDVPLVDERVRVREIDLATDPTDADNLAVGLIVSLPSMRSNPPHDWPLWDGLARSSDGGATWQLATLPGWPGDPTLTPWTPSLFLSDPIVTFLHDGTLLLSILAVQPTAVSMVMLRYPPGALEPESSSVVVRSALTTTADAHLLPIGPPFTVYNDKQQVFEDPTTGDLFVTWFWRTDDPTTVSRAQPMLAKSTDGGRTWSAPVVVHPDGHYDDPSGGFHAGSWPFVTRDGALHVVWWDDQTDKLYQADSPDRGATFGAANAIADAATEFGAPRGVIQLGMPSIDVDRSGGRFDGSVYVTWEDRQAGDRDVFVIRSRDDARSWSEPVRVNADPEGNGADQALPQLAVAPDGTVGVLYLDFGDDAAGRMFWPTVARSSDGGVSFTSHRVAREPSDVGRIDNGDAAPDPAGRTRLGDYLGLAHNGDGFVAVWQDGREGTAAVPYSNAYVCRLAAG